MLAVAIAAMGTEYFFSRFGKRSGGCGHQSLRSLNFLRKFIVCSPVIFASEVLFEKFGLTN